MPVQQCKATSHLLTDAQCFIPCQRNCRHPDASSSAKPASAEDAEEGAAAAEGEGEGAAPTAGGEDGSTEQQPPSGPQVPAPIKERCCHAAVAVDRDLYILGGDNTGDLLKEYAMCDTNDRAVANWLEPILKGDIPAPRKASAAAASGNKIIMFGGVMANAEEQMVTVSELVVFDISGPNDLTATIDPPTNGIKPAARSFAIMTEYSSGKLFLYGGLDSNNKPLNDGWLLDVSTMTWECVFNGHSDLVLPTGSVATLINGRLVTLNSATGSPKLDLAASIDFIEVREQYSFAHKMKQEAMALLEGLESWADKQMHGMELARNLEKLGQSFDSLLKVMDALFQVRAPPGVIGWGRQITTCQAGMYMLGFSSQCSICLITLLLCSVAQVPAAPAMLPCFWCQCR